MHCKFLIFNCICVNRSVRYAVLILIYLMHTLQGVFVEKRVRKFNDTKGKLTIYIFCRHKTLISYVLTFIFLFTPELPPIAKLFRQKQLIKKKYTANMTFTIYL
jgi:hypothetical protein